MLNKKLKKDSFVKGTFIATFAIILTKFLGMIYVIPFYAIIGEQGGALYAYAYNVYVLFLGIATAGIPTAMSKIISEYNTLEMYEAKDRAYKIGRNMILLISLIAFFCLFVFAEEFASLILGDISGGNTIQDVAIVVRCVSFCLLIIPFLAISRGYLQGHKYITPSSNSQIIEQLVRIFVILTGSFVALNLFNSSLTTGVGISVLAAFVGGLIAYIYLKIKINKNKDKFNLNYQNKDKVTTKEIIKKILTYSIPIVIVSISIDVYGLIDMILINRGLDILNYNGADIEVITTIITTWATKICMVINAVSIGMSLSIMPHLTSSFVQKNMVSLNHKFNKALQIVLLASVPMAIGISILSQPVYTLFYGESEYGAIILSGVALLTIFVNIFIILNMCLQSMNKYKVVFTTTIVGFVLNAALDIPLILLFDKIGIPAYLGAIVASMIGYIISFIITLTSLKKGLNINYSQTRKTIKKMILPTFLMSLVLILLNFVIPMDTTNPIIIILIILLYVIIGCIIYLGILYKNKSIEEVFGAESIEKIKTRLKKIFKRK